MSGISPNLDLRQSQSLVMTPQLQQAIKLLQMSNVELNEYVEEELEKNPLLEKDDSPLEAKADSEGENDASPEPTQTSEIDQPAQEAPLDTSHNETGNDDFDAGSSMADVGSGGDLKFENAEDSFENRMSADKTLREHLQGQLFVVCDDARDQMIGHLLIDQLDEAGYLRSNPEDLAEKLGCKPERIDRLLGVMKGFDPTGIFAADLSECLALQLAEKNTLDGPMQALLDNLDMLGNHDVKGLAKICDVNDQYLKDMIAEIKELNPKPAGDFDHLVVQTAIPDVLMKRLPKHVGGGWRIEINSDTLPRVLVNQEYYTQVKTGSSKKEDREYITTQLNNANWLVRSMEQRAQTILKTASEIVEQQDAFFNYGIEFLKPLKLVDIAKEIEMHESTVSRVTTGKYIGTPRGIFELKYFFSTALTSADGISHSSSSIKARIKTLIDEEDVTKILSDDKIVAILKAEGIDLARRTVAKYREAMHIGSSVQRRKQKKNLTE
jgi:RNA polymerase sigma-54 factor